VSAFVEIVCAEVKRERDAEDDDGEIEVIEVRPVKKRTVDTIDLTDD